MPRVGKFKFFCREWFQDRVDIKAIVGKGLDALAQRSSETVYYNRLPEASPGAMDRFHFEVAAGVEEGVFEEGVFDGDNECAA